MGTFCFVSYPAASSPTINASLPPSRSNLYPPATQLILPTRRKLHLNCAKLSPPMSHYQDHEQEWMDVEFGKLVKEKCRERKGVVELLECLETEAIMGDDEGKDPTDYNRRAQIFDRSSIVFQSLKNQQNQP